MPDLPGVAVVTPENGGYKLTLQPGVEPVDIMAAIAGRRLQVDKFEIAMPSLDEIFIRIVGENPELAEQAV